MNTRSSGKKATTSKNPSAKRSAAGKRAKAKEPAPQESGSEEEPLGAIMSKGIELAEAGLNLGINLVHKFGGSLQEQVIEKIAKSGGTIFKAAPGTEQHTSTQDKKAADADKMSNANGGSGNFNGISNRLPSFPGGELRISFSINNDSISEVRQVHLSIESDLVGELSNALLSKKLLAIQPSKASIAPADFDKFTIVATVPINQQADHYFGAIVVDGEEKMRIPLRVSVTGFSS